MNAFSYPWPALVSAFVITLTVSALGFRRTDFFVSLGYGFSIALLSIVFLFGYLGSLDVWTLVQAALLFGYGARLSSHLIARERQPSFAHELEASKARSRHIKGWLKIVIWVSVAALYVTMYAPALINLSAHADNQHLPSLGLGIAIAAIGLAIETLADWQKTQFKKAKSQSFCDVGLFSAVRCPNYFGEMVFWLGIFISGLSAYASLLDWAIALIGLVCIQLIMLGSARRLELKQGDRYGADPAYQDYVHNTPILFPFVPLRSLKNLKVYLG